MLYTPLSAVQKVFYNCGLLPTWVCETTSPPWSCVNIELTDSVPGLALEADILIRAGAAVPVAVAPRVDQDPGMSLWWSKLVYPLNGKHHLKFAVGKLFFFSLTHGI